MRVLLLAVLLAGCAANRPYDQSLFEMGSGFTAKEACSCLYVMGRPLDWCREWTAVRPNVARTRVDEDARLVTTVRRHE